MNLPDKIGLPALLGPGRFVAVVGPSGAGKDTIMAGARAALAQNRTFAFPRRIVTRAASETEDHDSLDQAEFARQREQGSFALHWQAHGLYYGIPRSVDDEIRANHTAICNVSRGAVSTIRARYANVTVVLVTAPAEVLAQRLSGRARASDGSLSSRIERNAIYPDVGADVAINNNGLVDAAVRELLVAISGRERR